MLNDDSYRTGTSDTPVCECASERETVEHFLIRCPRYKQFRSDLISTVQEIGTSAKFKSHLHNESISCTLLGRQLKQERG